MVAKVATEKPQGNTGLTPAEEASLIRVIRNNHRVLGKIIFPCQGYLNEEHRESSRVLVQACIMFNALAGKYPTKTDLKEQERFERRLKHFKEQKRQG